MPQEIQLFDSKQIRTYWNENLEKYFFCVIDVVAALINRDSWEIHFPAYTRSLWRVKRRKFARGLVYSK